MEQMKTDGGLKLTPSPKNKLTLFHDENVQIYNEGKKLIEEIIFYLKFIVLKF